MLKYIVLISVIFLGFACTSGIKIDPYTDKNQSQVNQKNCNNECKGLKGKQSVNCNRRCNQ